MKFRQLDKRITEFLNNVPVTITDHDGKKLYLTIFNREENNGPFWEEVTISFFATGTPLTDDEVARYTSTHISITLLPGQSYTPQTTYWFTFSALRNYEQNIAELEEFVWVESQKGWPVIQQRRQSQY